MATAFAQNWLEIQCRSIQYVERAIFVLADSEDRRLKMAASWPVDNEKPSELLATVRLAARKKNTDGGVRATLTSNQRFDYFAWPIFVNGHLLGIVAVQTKHQEKPVQRSILQTLKVGAQWLALPEPETEKQEQLFQNTVRLALGITDQADYRAMLTALVNLLILELHCDRVSFGAVKEQHCEVVAVSNSANMDAKANLIKAVAHAMDEAIDQDSILNFPAVANDQNIYRAHKELAKNFGSGSILTVPLVHQEKIFATVTLERNESHPFTASEANFCHQLMLLLAPSFYMRERLDQPLTKRLSEDARDSFGAVFGLSRLRLKLSLTAAALLVGFSAFTSTQFNVSAGAALEGRIQRSIAAPIAGYIDTAIARAGDTVDQGDIIATMDDSELRLQEAKLEAQRQQTNRALREAMATRDLVQVRVLNAQLDQANAELKLVQDQLERTRIRAPFNAIIIDGDLSDQLGAPVERGDSLFRIAPLSGYRVILKVREQDIAFVQNDQIGTLTLASLPGEHLPLTVEKITAVATAEDGANVFRVEAALSEAPEILRPGMGGVAKINVGERRMLWIWTRDIVDWIRLKLWSWWP
ncbi:HlyD family efflux transporter periplasmic adaptor subunit [Halioxenophilus aromaticivorans]|uniref:GAF domain-containing protein n=1 Tax=Halioxenophilus aromaticivorans TaxID=1306992 RepID=A0AAV3U267_9ALTE